MVRKLAAFLFLLVLCAARLSAKIEDGIVFRSYNVQAEERTSLCIPAGENGWISFSDSLSVSFSVKIDLAVGHFGYICRMLLDGDLPLDIVLSPSGSETVVCATGNHRGLVDVFGDGHDLEQWRDIYVRVFREGSDLVFTANGKEVFRTQSAARHHRIRMVFGKVDLPGFVTSDVAPMMLADLQIRRDAGKVASWMLSAPEDLRMQQGISIQAVNHLFARDLNCHWTRILSAEVPSVTYACFSKDGNEVFLVSRGQILVADVRSSSVRRLPFSTDIRNDLTLDQFVTLEDGTLVLADAPMDQFIRFDAEKGDWERPSDRTRRSIHLHHNTVLAGGRFFQLFGYGQHRYSNTAWIWDPATFRLDVRELTGVAPRYLAGAGEHDGRIYVLGGKGNESGRQELGVYQFDSLLEVDPGTFTPKTLWTNPVLRKYTPAQDLLFLEGGIYALLFDPEVHDSALHLTRFNPENGTDEFLSEPIPFPFLDITSQARLAFNRETESFIAVLCYQDGNGGNKAELYALSTPVLAAQKEAESSGGFPGWVYLVLTALAAGSLVFWLIRAASRRKPEEVDVPEEPALPSGPGIYLLGGFHVRDREGKDITSSFSPTLMQFLAILVLYTAEKGGVSNAKLKSILWPDKSDESFNNNKGVNLKKLRAALELVGPVTVGQEGGVWRIEDGTHLCDYFAARDKLARGERSQILRVASWGPLLPEYPFEWLDPFKAGYADNVLNLLSSIEASGVSPEVSLRIADSRLLFDSLDEEAIACKCRSLISLGRSGTAKAVFERFTSDYLRVMGEEFPEDFSSFLKK